MIRSKRVTRFLFLRGCWAHTREIEEVSAGTRENLFVGVSGVTHCLKDEKAMAAGWGQSVEDLCLLSIPVDRLEMA